MKYVKNSISVCFFLIIAACSKEPIEQPVDSTLNDDYTVVDSDILFSPDLKVEVITEARFYYADGSDATHEAEMQMASQMVITNPIDRQ